MPYQPTRCPRCVFRLNHRLTSHTWTHLVLSPYVLIYKQWIQIIWDVKIKAHMADMLANSTLTRTILPAGFVNTIESYICSQELKLDHGNQNTNAVWSDWPPLTFENSFSRWLLWDNQRLASCQYNSQLTHFPSIGRRRRVNEIARDSCIPHRAGDSWATVKHQLLSCSATAANMKHHSTRAFLSVVSILCYPSPTSLFICVWVEGFLMIIVESRCDSRYEWVVSGSYIIGHAILCGIQHLGNSPFKCLMIQGYAVPSSKLYCRGTRRFLCRRDEASKYRLVQYAPCSPADVRKCVLPNKRHIAMREWGMTTEREQEGDGKGRSRLTLPGLLCIISS